MDLSTIANLVVNLFIVFTIFLLGCWLAASPSFDQAKLVHSYSAILVVEIATNCPGSTMFAFPLSIVCSGGRVCCTHWSGHLFLCLGKNTFTKINAQMAGYLLCLGLGFRAPLEMLSDGKFF